LKEIKSKKAKAGKKILKQDEQEITKRSYKCDCACVCKAEGLDSADYDDGFDLAFEDDDPACGCSCGGNADLEQTCDMAWED